MAFDSCSAASVLAIEAFALLRLACKGAGSISNKTWPSLTFDPSSNNRFSRMPVARARTCASRTELIRPGSSVVRLTRSDATVTTETSAGGGGRGVLFLFRHAPSPAPRHSVKVESSVFERIDFIKLGKVRQPGSQQPQRRSVFEFAF